MNVLTKTVFSLLLILTLTQTTGLAQPAAGSHLPPRAARNAILVVTDGMCANALRFARDLLVGRGNQLVLDRFPVVGRMIGYPLDGPVLDSAAAATSFSCGGPSPLHKIGLETNGQPVPSLFYAAKARGYRIGLISDTRLTHATPAPFAANVKNRDDETEIAGQMVQSEFNVLFSGGLRYFLPQELGGKQPDGKNLIELARSRGYVIATTSQDLDQAVAAKANRVLGLFSPSFLPFPWEKTYNPAFSLDRMTKAGLSILERGKGFLLMVEAGKMDVANHSHDAISLLQAMAQLEATLKVLTDYVKQHPDTVLIVASDHATGNFKVTEHFHDGIFRQLATSTFALAETLKGRQQTFEQDLERLLPDIRFTAGEIASLRAQQSFEAFKMTLGTIFFAKLGLSFFETGLQEAMPHTHGHSSEDLFVHAMGRNQELFGGSMRIWDIPHRMAAALKLSWRAPRLER